MPVSVRPPYLSSCIAIVRDRVSKTPADGVALQPLRVASKAAGDAPRRSVSAPESYARRILRAHATRRSACLVAVSASCALESRPSYSTVFLRSSSAAS